MTRYLTLGAMLGLAMAFSAAAAPSPTHEKPRLVLQITVDQLRGDLPTRYIGRIGQGGLRYLLEEGIRYNNAHHAHATTETIVGLMKVKVWSAVVVNVVSTWFGGSLVSSSELSLEEEPAVVGAEHPDSHRLGILLEEEVDLPSWDRQAAGEVLPKVVGQKL